MRSLFLAAAFFAPSAAFACAMPHFDEKQLAQVMAEIDAATPTTPAPAPAPKAEPAPAPKADAATTIPEATTPPLTKAKTRS